MPQKIDAERLGRYLRAAGRWMLYALIWWLMFELVEVGQAITPDHSWLDAIGGIVAEAIYFPLAAFGVVRVLSRREPIDGSV